MNQNQQYVSGAIDAMECITQGWEALKPKYGIFLGITVVSMLCFFVVACIPLVGLILMGPLTCGLYYVFLKQLRGEEIEFGMMFKGFEVFVAAMVAAVIISIPQILNQFIDIAGMIINLAATMSGNETAMGAATVAGLGGTLLQIVLGLASLVMGILFFFSYPLVMDRKLSGIEAVKLSFHAAKANLGGIIVLVILEALMLLAGFLALCVGIIFVAPIVMMANAYAFNKVFPSGANPNPMMTTPPSPNEYGDMFSQ